MLSMVFLDAALTPHQFVFQLTAQLSKLGNLSSYATTVADEVLPRCAEAEIILVNKVRLTREHFRQLPKLKYVVVVATGYDNVEVAAAHDLGIKVSNIPGYSTLTVAQHTIALILELTNQVGKVSQQVKLENNWLGIKQQHLELASLTLGIVGFGQIAQKVIPIALALGMQVIVASNKSSYTTELPVKFVDKESLFKLSDIISLHCPLNPSTSCLINKESLALLKPSALLVNTARGGLIHEADLYFALLNKQLQGAALDVLTIEPPSLDNPLLKLDNCIITPHNGWLSAAALTRWVEIIVANITSYLTNKWLNLV